MRLSETDYGRGEPADNMLTIDHGKLTNEELYRLVCDRIPHMAFLVVTDETRETAIAMLKVSE